MYRKYYSLLNICNKLITNDLYKQNNNLDIYNNNKYLLFKLNKSKNKIDDNNKYLNIFKYKRNIYENISFISNINYISRSYFKLAEILVDFNIKKKYYNILCLA